MKQYLSRLMSILLLLLAAPLAQADAYLNGLWSGAYDYGDQLGPNAVWFSVVFETNGDEIKGRSIEVQTFGREPSVGLSATFKGHSAGGVVSLVKQYDGSGGQTHAVHIRLSYDAEQNLVGEWLVDQQTKGRIELFKLAFRPETEGDDWLEDWD